MKSEPQNTSWTRRRTGYGAPRVSSMALDGQQRIADIVPILTRNPDGPYYSKGDERAFFEWLHRIRCVQKVSGSGPALQIYVRSRKITRVCLRELIALFWRYQVPMDQLAQFESASNRKWFRNPATFWYRAVFRSGKPSNKPLQPTRDRADRPSGSRRRPGATRG